MTESEELFQKGMKYYNETEYNKAIVYLKKAGEKNHAKAQQYLGNCYTFGYGVIKNLYTAFQWYLKSARNGEKGAQFVVSECYEQGKGVTKSDSNAAYWYAKAAENQHGGAAVRLAVMYLEGRGVVKYSKKAFDLLFRFKNNDYFTAYDGEYWLGYCYEFGLGTPKNLVLAFTYYISGADRWSERAKKAMKRVEKTAYDYPCPVMVYESDYYTLARGVIGVREQLKKHQYTAFLSMSNVDANLFRLNPYMASYIAVLGQYYKTRYSETHDVSYFDKAACEIENGYGREFRLMIEKLTGNVSQRFIDSFNSVFQEWKKKRGL